MSSSKDCPACKTDPNICSAIHDEFMTAQPNQPEDTELREKVERYVAALAESGDNFMKPQNIPENLRQDYVNSLVRLIEAEASRREQALLDKLEKEASERYEAAGRHTTRNMFSRTTETRGEAYARTQGFKSALLVWKDCIATKRQAVTEKEGR